MGTHSRSQSRYYRDPHYSSSRSYYRPRVGCNPLFCCSCSFGGKSAQSFLLILIPLCITIISFLAGFWLIPVWTYDDGYQGKVRIAAQGCGVNGQDSGVRQFLYNTNSWPSPINGLPLLLLFHLIISILLATYLLFVISVCVYASRRRGRRELRSEAWSRVIIEQKWWERIISVLLTLLVGTVLVMDNVVWGIGRSKGQNLNPDVLGYFVNIVALLLWVFWVIVQCAATHDLSGQEDLYVGGRRMRATRSCC